MNLTFRTTPEKEDIEKIKNLALSSGFFYDHEVAVAVELITERLTKGESTGYHFVFAEADSTTVAYSCYGHIEMTKSCYDLYWLVTHNDYRGKGIGKKLLEATYVEAKKMGCTMIIAETSGREKYIPTQSFYISAGYKLEASIRDYYDKGDDKLIYIKRFE